jgi:hypothetical protein
MIRRRSSLALVPVLALTWALAAAEDPGAQPPPPATQEDSSASHAWHGDWDAGEQEVTILGDIEVPAGKVHDGDVVCVGGKVTIGGTVTGDVVVIGGSLVQSGTVHGQVVGVGSTIELTQGASIDGELVNVLGSLDDRGASVAGNRVSLPFGLPLPGIKAPFAVLGAILFWGTVVSLVLFFIGIFLFAALVPHRVLVLSEEAPVSLLWAFLVGLGVYVALPIVEFLLFCTVLGIPILFCLHFVVLALKWLGMVGILHYLGSRIGKLFGRDLSIAGSVLLAFALVAILKLVPFAFGGLFGLILLLGIKVFLWLFLEVPALGLIVLTRAGSRPRKPASLATPAIAVPPVAVPPVVPPPSTAGPS